MTQYGKSHLMSDLLLNGGHAASNVDQLEIVVPVETLEEVKSATLRFLETARVGHGLV